MLLPLSLTPLSPPIRPPHPPPPHKLISNFERLFSCPLHAHARCPPLITHLCSFVTLCTEVFHVHTSHKHKAFTPCLSLLSNEFSPLHPRATKSSATTHDSAGPQPSFFRSSYSSAQLQASLGPSVLFSLVQLQCGAGNDIFFCSTSRQFCSFCFEFPRFCMLACFQRACFAVLVKMQESCSMDLSPLDLS